jgi:hypothetical protein
VPDEEVENLILEIPNLASLEGDRDAGASGETVFFWNVISDSSAH